MLDSDSILEIERSLRSAQTLRLYRARSRDGKSDDQYVPQPVSPDRVDELSQSISLGPLF